MPKCLDEQFGIGYSETSQVISHGCCRRKSQNNAAGVNEYCLGLRWASMLIMLKARSISHCERIPLGHFFCYYRQHCKERADGTRYYGQRVEGTTIMSDIFASRTTATIKCACFTEKWRSCIRQWAEGWLLKVMACQAFRNDGQHLRYTESCGIWQPGLQGTDL
jgi:hypothetical protein